MRIQIISQRGQMQHTPSWDAVFEFEDLLQDCLDAQITVLQSRSGLGRVLVDGPLRFRRGFVKQYIPRHRVLTDPFPTTDLLLVMALTPMALENLQSIPRWREKSGTVIVYIVDSYRYDWYRFFRRTLQKVDHIITPIPGSVSGVEKATGVPTSPLPWGTDVLRNGSGSGDRRLDVIAMGRQPPEQMAAIARRFGQKDSGRFLFHGVIDVRHGERRKESRELMWQMMRSSHLSLCYCPSFWCAREDAPPMITPRWLESLCAGAIPVGKSPATPLSSTMFDWKDALIDLPTAPEKAANTLFELLDDSERLRKAHARNYVNMLRKHDWRYRIQSLLDLAGGELTNRLEEELQELQSRAAEAGSPL